MQLPIYDKIQCLYNVFCKILACTQVLPIRLYNSREYNNIRSVIEQEKNLL